MDNFQLKIKKRMLIKNLSNTKNLNRFKILIFTRKMKNKIFLITIKIKKVLWKKEIVSNIIRTMNLFQNKIYNLFLNLIK